MLIDTLKKRMFSAMKANSTVEKELIRTVIGEVTSTGEDPTDERVIGVLRKMIKSNGETKKVSTDPAQQAALAQELSILEEFVPPTLNVEQIVHALAPVLEAVKAAGNDGQATGVAMKHLRNSGAEVNGKDVTAAVKQIRK
jgi:uncharacterized protein